jgi:hypothetical protein
VPAIVRRFGEDRLPELVVAAVARDSRTSPAPAEPGVFPVGWHRHGVQLTCALPGHSSEPDRQNSGWFLNKEADI